MFKLMSRFAAGCLLLCASALSLASEMQPPPEPPNIEDASRLPWEAPAFAKGVLFEVELLEDEAAIARYRLGIPSLAPLASSDVRDTATEFSAQLFSQWMSADEIGLNVYFNWGSLRDRSLSGKSALGLKIGDQVVLAASTGAPARSLVVRLISVESVAKQKAAAGD